MAKRNFQSRVIGDGKRSLKDVNFVDLRYGWAVGYSGLILKTQDGGKTWKDQSLSANYFFDTVHFLNRQAGYVAGCRWHFGKKAIECRGVILETGDGGRNWKVVQEASLWLHDIFFLDEKRGWAVGGRNGASVEVIKPCQEVGRRRGFITWTEDGGKHWSEKELTSLSWPKGIFFVDSLTGWAIGEDGLILNTLDGGKTWQKQKSPTEDSSFRRAFFIDKDCGWIAGENAIILHTKNGGRRWYLQDPGVDKALRESFDLEDIHFIDRKNGWVVGYLGTTILHTSDGGKTWKQEKTNTRCWLHAIHFVDEDHGWAVGDRDTILHTSNGGKSWVVQAGGQAKIPLMIIQAHVDDYIAQGGVIMAKYCADFGYPGAIVNCAISAARNSPGVFKVGRGGKGMFSIANGLVGIHTTRCFDEFLTAGAQGIPECQPASTVIKGWGGTKRMERQLVEAIRTWQPEVIISHEPLFGEYGKPCHKAVGKIALMAYRSAGDRKNFSELAKIGLGPWQPKKLYQWTTRTLPSTLDIDEEEFSRKLGKTYRQLVKEAMSFWPDLNVWWRPGNLYLVRSQVGLAKQEEDIFERIDIPGRKNVDKRSKAISLEVKLKSKHYQGETGKVIVTVQNNSNRTLAGRIELSLLAKICPTGDLWRRDRDFSSWVRLPKGGRKEVQFEIKFVVPQADKRYQIEVTPRFGRLRFRPVIEATWIESQPRKRKL